MTQYFQFPDSNDLVLSHPCCPISFKRPGKDLQGPSCPSHHPGTSLSRAHPSCFPAVPALKDTCPPPRWLFPPFQLPVTFTMSKQSLHCCTSSLELPLVNRESRLFLCFLEKDMVIMSLSTPSPYHSQAQNASTSPKSCFQHSSSVCSLSKLEAETLFLQQPF